ncbi:MAG: alpha/beta fold hydrolase [Planctomycetes bacterium]|nr:alpha/beta fold hydrolase [Planctomycetota bacterium]
MIPFEPHPWLKSAHLQTVVGTMRLPGEEARSAGLVVHHEVPLLDGDALVLHDELAIGWRQGGPVALLIHGLGGDAQSPYLHRIGAKLRRRGVRTLRVDLRGFGASAPRCRQFFHSGRSDDVRAALKAVAALCPGSPIRAAGFSLGGHLLLRALGQSPGEIEIERAVAVSPPCDLESSVEKLREGAGALYDRYFARLLVRHVAERVRADRSLRLPALTPPPANIVEFDERFTAPMAGFASAREYYRSSESVSSLDRIAIPTSIWVSRDDPVVAVGAMERAPRSPWVEIHITAAGGHLGFVARADAQGDRRWMDARVVESLARGSEGQ